MGSEQHTVHTVEEVGWFHHAWDEYGGEFVTGVCLITVAFLAYMGVRYRYRARPNDES